ncbi:MAG: fumarylacetoacetate hydrolase family protein [Bacteroidota bacterium]|nr:fumarylacetoacetate hydrolase family protein [Bacteroidota bacterium]
MKLICVGRNYNNHIAELQNKRPYNPLVFLKPDSAILLKNQPFFIPEFSDNIQYEVELIVKINRVGKYISPDYSAKYYDQIGLGIDFTARDLQQDLKQKGLPWEKAKAFDGSAVIGNWVSKSNFKNIDQLSFGLKKNGRLVQSGNSQQMLWNIDDLIAYVSQYFTLKIGDVIFTGTPAGVGAVVAGDTLTGYIEKEEFFSVKIK